MYCYITSDMRVDPTHSHATLHTSAELTSIPSILWYVMRYAETVVAREECATCPRQRALGAPGGAERDWSRARPVRVPLPRDPLLRGMRSDYMRDAETASRLCE